MPQHTTGRTGNAVSGLPTKPSMKLPLLALIFARIPTKWLTMPLVAVGLLLTSPRANAQTILSPADKSFIEAAAQGGLAEVNLGEEASQKGTRADVKAFGLLMVRDHTAMNNALRALAVEKGVILPSGLDARHQAMVDRIATVKGAAFDQAYIAGMIKAHQLDANDVKTELETTKDPDLRAFVTKLAAVVEDHLKRITALRQ